MTRHWNMKWKLVFSAEGLYCLGVGVFGVESLRA